MDRIDGPSEPFGFARMDRLVAMAQRRGVTTFPILYSPYRYVNKIDLEMVRTAARDYAFHVVSRYWSDIKYWALDNELDDFSILQPGDTTTMGEVWSWPNAPSGDKPEHYQPERFEFARAALLGLAEGVRAADPEAVAATARKIGEKCEQ